MVALPLDALTESVVAWECSHGGYAKSLYCMGNNLCRSLEPISYSMVLTILVPASTMGPYLHSVFRSTLKGSSYFGHFYSCGIAIVVVLMKSSNDLEQHQ